MKTPIRSDKNSFLCAEAREEAFNCDLAELRRVLSYDPGTGEFRWTKEAGFRGPAKHGDIAGCIRPACGGYRWICINYIQFRAHQLAWMYVNGMSAADQIDHINGNPADNRIANLRVVSNRTNSQNQRKPRSDNTTGYLGVSLDKRRGLYAARIRVPCGKYKFLGYHAGPKRAYAAYLAAKRILHEGCTL